MSNLIFHLSFIQFVINNLFSDQQLIIELAAVEIVLLNPIK